MYGICNEINSTFVITVNQIEVKAVPIDEKEIGDSDQGRKMRRVSQPDALTFGGHAHPSLETPYEVTVKDKMCYYAITIMKVCLI
jgi:E3 ubiquitin-protein ligase MYCBP2